MGNVIRNEMNNAAVCGLKGIETQVKIIFLQDKFITDDIDKKTKQGVSSTGGGITKGLQVHDPAERRVKIINDR